MNPGDDLFMGLDVGTSGVRAVVADAAGHVQAACAVPFPDGVDVRASDGTHEQDPERWWEAVGRSTAAVLSQSADASVRQRIRALSVTSTSGTVVLVDAAGRPCRPAILYNDSRSEPQAARLAAVGRPLADKLGYRFHSSFALPKLLWLAEHEPSAMARARWFCHAADFLVGRLTGRYDVTDTSNALKTGYDLLERRWPAWIEEELGLPLGRFPQVVDIGTSIGQVTSRAAQATGVPAGVRVVAGATDGTASFFASGVSRPGHWSSTIGTTLVLKGICERLVSLPEAGLYCHWHPQGWWLPGGASNAGGQSVAALFRPEELEGLNRVVFEHLPNDLVGYPLQGRGERFPFVDPQATGFWTRPARSRGELYAATLEAISFVERWSLDRLAGLGLAVVGDIFTSGGATRSAAWLKLRATCLGRRLLVADTPEAAFGAAIVAAASATASPLSDSSRRMVRIRQTIEPDPAWGAYLEEKYGRFREVCRQRGYG